MPSAAADIADSPLGLGLGRTVALGSEWSGEMALSYLSELRTPVGWKLGIEADWDRELLCSRQPVMAEEEGRVRAAEFLDLASAWPEPI